MHPAQQLENIRCRIRQSLAEFGASASVPVRETILVRDGFFCGRRFDCDGFQAVWFFEENQIKFHGRDGSVITVVDDAESLVHMPRRVA